MMKNLPNILIVILVILLIMSFKRCSRDNDNIEMYQNQIKALVEENTQYRNKNGELVTQARVFESTNASQILSIKSKDRAITQLQYEVTRLKRELNSKGGSVVYINTKTKVQLPADTIFVSYSGTGSIQYTDSLKRFGEWITGTVMLGKDTSSYDMTIHNEYLVSLYWKKDRGLKNLFKDKYPVCDITNKNPYTNTNNLRVVNVTQKKQSRLGLTVGIGYGLNSSFELKPMVGIMYGFKIM